MSNLDHLEAWRRAEREHAARWQFAIPYVAGKRSPHVQNGRSPRRPKNHDLPQRHLGPWPEWDGLWNHIQDAQLSWNITRDEVVFIRDLLAELRPDFICEWGTATGNSARVFHETRRWLRLNGEHHSVENGNIDPVHVKGCDVTLHRGDGPTTALDLYLSGDANRPLFFIDDHHYHQGTYDQIDLIHLEAPEAVILIHDAALSVAISGSGSGAQAYLRDNPVYQATELVTGSGMLLLWPRP